MPNNIIGAIADANTTRKDFVAETILKRKPQVVGIYRLIMKAGSDNFRKQGSENRGQVLILELSQEKSFQHGS